MKSASPSRESLSPKGKQRTVSADELPAWAHTYEFITAGYRNPFVHDTWGAALFSALQWHTESMNVHSHLWPGLGCPRRAFKPPRLWGRRPAF